DILSANDDGGPFEVSGGRKPVDAGPDADRAIDHRAGGEATGAGPFSRRGHKCRQHQQARNNGGQTPKTSGFHSRPSSDGGAMKPRSAEAATTAGLAREPSPPYPMRFCQFRLNDVIAHCPVASASGPCPKHGPHHDWRIWPPTDRNTSAIDSPP